MEVQLTPEVEKQVNDFATLSGQKVADVLLDALAGHFAVHTRTCDMVNSRYDDLENGRVKPVDGEEFFAELRRRENAV